MTSSTAPSPTTTRRPRATPAIAHAAAAAMLRTADGLAVPLVGVTARGRLEGLVFDLTVEQRYQNRADGNLEAVFTFPLPLHAVLLGFDLQIGERNLSAVAIARTDASRRYEQAMDTGDTAALIEHDGEGLYTVSLGNLMAGESAVIRYRYAELLDAHRGSVRLRVPTVIAPRYGDPGSAGLEGPAVPGADVLAEYPFSIRLLLAGLADAGAVGSPSHDVEVASTAEGLVLTLPREAHLDRDFVLEIDQARLPGAVLVARDPAQPDAFVGLASATLELDAAERRPLALKILLDCSGSMAGDSIAAARRAVLALLEQLDAGDRISLTRFGSSVEHMTEGLEAAAAHSLAPLAAVVRGIQADLGGTEMAAGLEATLALASPADCAPDLLLITDGEIYDVAHVVQQAAQSGHRLFAIAIGAAPNEPLARLLAEETGGACEFLGPSEDAESAILRTFKRLRSAPRELAAVDWPATPTWAVPFPRAVFPGDTLHVLAGFAVQPSGSVTLTVRDSAGQRTVLVRPVASQLTEGDLLPRLAAARRLGTLDADAARDLAVTYQLASAHTSFVVVAERAAHEKATGLPATVAVRHMLAAGWGGYGSVDMDSAPARMSAAIMARFVSSSSCEKFEPDAGRNMHCLSYLDSAHSDVPSWLRAAGVFEPADRLAALTQIEAMHRRGEPLPQTVRDLLLAGVLSRPVAMLLMRLARGTGGSEREFLAVFYALLAEDAAAAGFDDSFLGALRGNVLGSRRHRELRRRLMAEVFT